ncbi:MAG: HEAT repeat domain-containing protein [Phycisphaerae bacterium]|nr:HEAT repeat domain-containing protein [Phycisphaerae bacterium]
MMWTALGQCTKRVNKPSPQQGSCVSKVILSVVLTSLLTGAAPPSSGPLAPEPGSLLQTQPARLSAEDQRRFNDFVDLLKEQNTPKARRTGARELLDAGWPQAVEVLLDVLQNEKDPMAQMAVIEVIAESDKPDAVFIQPLIRLLGSKDDRMRDAAADALARYNNGGVVGRLSRLARGQEQPVTDLAMRVAAIRALSQVSDRKEAMEVLVELLGDPNPEIRVRSAQAVGDAAGVEFSTDVGAIKKWWQVDQSRSDLGRSRDRYLVKIKQNRGLQKRLEAVQTILVATLRKLYLRMPEAQKTDTLLEYLQDPMPEVRLLGLELVNALLTDRKKVPEPVLMRVRSMIPDTSARVRREVALTLRDLRDVTDAKRLLSQYGLETDSTVRAAMLNALGRLGDPEAISVMIDALSSDDKQIVAEGAMGLAVLGQEGHVPAEQLTPAIKPLTICYRKLAASDQLLREQMLEAMARIADPQFRPIFVDGLDTANEAPVRQAAARGIAALGKAENAQLLVDHLSDPDPGVRRTVVDALARIAKTDHLEALFGRLDARTESDTTVRTRAWEGIRQIVRSLPLAEQRRWIDTHLDPKLDKATAERYVELMTEIEKDLALATPPAPDLLKVREQLADGLTFAGQFAEAARVYRMVHESLSKSGAPEAWKVGLKLFGAQLQADRYDEAIALAETLTSPTDERQRDQLAAVLRDHLKDLLKANEPDRAIVVLKLVGGRYGPRWKRSFDELQQQAETVRREQDIAAVRRCLTQLRGDAMEVDRARQQIRTLGLRAVRPLAEELKALLMSPEAAPGRETQILDLLKLVVPDWNAYSDQADKAAKLRALEKLPSELPTEGG